MFDLVSDVRGSDVVVEALWIILDYNFTLAFTFVFSFDKLFLNVIIAKRLDERTEFLLLVVSS